MEHQKKNYQELGLDSLKDREWLRSLCYLYKIVSTKIPPYLYEILLPLQRLQCNPGCFKPLICQTELFQNYFLPYTITEWDKLHPDIRNVENYLLFCD